MTSGSTIPVRRFPSAPAVAVTHNNLDMCVLDVSRALVAQAGTTGLSAASSMLPYSDRSRFADVCVWRTQRWHQAQGSLRVQHEYVIAARCSCSYEHICS